MNNLAKTNIHRLVEVANELTQQESVSRIINSFGVWQSDAHKQPLVFQVDVTIKDIGGDNTRTERGFYFVPTTMPDHALLIAKSMATLDFFNSKYPELEMETQVGTVETENKVSEEKQPETQAVEGKVQPVSVEPAKKTRKPRTTKPKEVVAEASVAEEVGGNVAEKPKHSAYDNTKLAHKDALIAMLDKEFEGWRNLGKDKTKAMSAALVGKDFMDEAGLIIPEFKELVKQYV